MAIKDDPTKLYKCIGFAHPYWAYIALEQRIRFATIPELLKGNDNQEFDHRWDSNSPSFQYLANEMRAHYDALYLKTVILSMGQSPNQRCWTEYCEQGGVRYEFEYDASRARASEVSCKTVDYDDNKTFNLSRFMLMRKIDENIRGLFQSTMAMTRPDGLRLLSWLKSGEPGKITLEHASNEIPYKKITSYKFENEYRFVHLKEQIEKKPLKTVLDQQKIALEELGMKLVRICTSDIERVKGALPGCEVEISDVSFSD
jgi:hypothetical protein